MSLIRNLFIIIFVSIATLKVIDISFGLLQPHENTSLTKGTDRSIVLREINPNQYASIRPNNNYMKDVENLEQINYEINIDENGFIANGNLKTSNSEIKILFLGGSTTETLFVPEKSRFPSVIERNLRSELDQTVNVYNGGVSGNHSMHSVFILLAKGIPLEPNYAVLMHNINDFALLSKTESYWEAPKSRSLVVKNVDGNFTTIEDSSRNILFNIIKTAKDSLAPNLYTYLRPRLFADIQFHRDEFEGFSKNFNDLDIDKVEQQFRSSITSFIKLSRAWNIEPILMTQANRIDPNLEYFQKWFIRYQRGVMTAREFSDVYKRLNEVIREIALQENVTLIDLDVLIPKNKEFLYDTIHVNEAGSILMADIVSAQILEVIKSQESN
jgi:lysophospholipase L1-like esterase|tara:strand:- start:3069 stop:4223 length:1155 start_codon:yes stop_codon:yes gene_type:complete